MDKPFTYYRNTKSRVRFEREEAEISQMDDDAEGVEFEQFAAECEYEEVAKALGYDPPESIDEDWSVSFARSRFDGEECYVIEHTECDFIFLRRAVTVDRLAEAEAWAISDAEWRRHTGYGHGAVDPR